MAPSEQSMTRAATLVARMRVISEELYADNGEMPVEEVDDLWGKYFEAQTELEQLIPPDSAASGDL
jgi:hypothetical protein